LAHGQGSDSAETNSFAKAAFATKAFSCRDQIRQKKAKRIKYFKGPKGPFFVPYLNVLRELFGWFLDPVLKVFKRPF
jgi:hypothetical protein